MPTGTAIFLWVVALIVFVIVTYETRGGCIGFAIFLLVAYKLLEWMASAGFLGPCIFAILFFAALTALAGGL